MNTRNVKSTHLYFTCFLYFKRGFTFNHAFSFTEDLLIFNVLDKLLEFIDELAKSHKKKILLN